MRLHNIIIANSTFPLSTMRPGKKEALIQAIIRKRLDDSNTLQSQMRIFKVALEANRAHFPGFN